MARSLRALGLSLRAMAERLEASSGRLMQVSLIARNML
jgi:hypothetical protein